MSNSFRPILGASMFDPREKRWREFEEVRYPVLATPKIDGIRLLTMNLPCAPEEQSVPMTRALKMLPSNAARRRIAEECMPFLDGELVGVGIDGKEMPFHSTQSLLMSENAPNVGFRYYVFDYAENPEDQYYERAATLQSLDLPDFCVKLLPQLCCNANELREYEKKCLEDGHEGICYRIPSAPYKFGRSTWREQYLIKVKRFLDSDAVVVGFEELYSNRNMPEINELGYQKRSSHRDNMVPMGTLGALIAQSPEFKRPFKVGTGFTQAARDQIWENQPDYLRRYFKFKHQPHGVKDAPRIPVFLAWRDERDIIISDQAELF